MKRLSVGSVIAGVVVCALLLGGLPAARAQDWPPAIFMFESDLDSITMQELEAGETEATLRWHIAHVDPTQQIMLHAYIENAWVPLGEPGDFAPVGELLVTVENPRNFGPPAYRVAVMDAVGQIAAQRVHVIPFAEGTADLVPSVFSFSALDQSIPAADLAAGTARVRISWVVNDRPPRSHIMFMQVIGEETVNVELPRPVLYIPSQGSGVVAPVAPPAEADTGMITLRLVVVDVISSEVLDSADVTVAVTGTALPTETPADAAPTPTEEPAAPSFGALNVIEDCTLFPPGVPERGWIDSPGIPSPNGRFIAYVQNSVGSAKLVIAEANGDGQFVVPAPDPERPLWSRPRWSPDSTRIAFNNITIESPGGGMIYVVNADGSDLRQVASYTGYYDDLAWSEDGALIYFTAGAATQAEGMTAASYQIYAVPANGLGTPEPLAPGCGVLE